MGASKPITSSPKWRLWPTSADFLIFALLALLPACAVSDTSVPFQTGADVLVSGGSDILDGKRIGLVVNHTSTTANGHLIDVLHASPDIQITALFGPEHGIRGEADAGAAVGDGTDPVTGAPIYSLYGAIRQPTAEMLHDVDVLVFDIQDVGARFYTYISTMGLAMQSAARAGIPFVVLDRPNPLGGVRMDGFVLEPDHASFVGQYPIPVQHGLTVGELALMIKGESWLEDVADVDLTVIPMTGWNRNMLWPETGLTWVAPSPNLPTFDSAVMYPGTCFIEATSASEGRGTDTPFLTIGAPWMKTESMTEALSTPWAGMGLLVVPSEVTPRSIPGVSTHPKWEDTPLHTVQIDVIDPSVVTPLAAGMVLLTELRDQAPDSTVFNQRWMTRLAGTERLGQLLRDGASARDIVTSWSAELNAFGTLRAQYLLYD